MLDQRLRIGLVFAGMHAWKDTVFWALTKHDGALY